MVSLQNVAPQVVDSSSDNWWSCGYNVVDIHDYGVFLSLSSLVPGPYGITIVCSMEVDCLLLMH